MNISHILNRFVMPADKVNSELHIMPTKETVFEKVTLEAPLSSSNMNRVTNKNNKQMMGMRRRCRMMGQRIQMRAIPRNMLLNMNDRKAFGHLTARSLRSQAL
jgi:hypothetical protein